MARLGLLFCLVVTGFGASASGAADGTKIYCGQFDACTNARILAQELSSMTKRPFEVNQMLGDSGNLAMQGFRKNAAPDRKVMLATPSMSQLDLSALTQVAVLGRIGGYPQPWAVYVEPGMPEAAVAELRRAVAQLQQRKEFRLSAEPVAAASPVTGAAIDANTQLREVKTRYPDSPFEEAAAVQQLCLPTSARPPLGVANGKNFLRTVEFSEVMQQGRELARVSDWWAKALVGTVLAQREQPARNTNGYNFSVGLNAANQANADAEGTPRQPGRSAPRPAPAKAAVSELQRDLDHNAAVLDFWHLRISTGIQNYYGNLRSLEANTLTDMRAAALPPADVLVLLKQYDRFQQDNRTCVNERLLGRRRLDDFSGHGWPVVPVLPDFRQPPWHEQQARARGNAEKEKAAYVELAAAPIRAARPQVLRMIREAKAPHELPQAMFTVFGAGRMNDLALEDPEISSAFRARSDTLLAEERRRAEELARQRAAEEQRREVARLARYRANVTANGKPEADDMARLITTISMELTRRSLSGAETLEAVSPTRYEAFINILGGKWKTAVFTLDVSNLKCRPEGGNQRCTYTEQADLTRFAVMQAVSLEPSVEVHPASGLFKWTPAGLDYVESPKVSSLYRGSGDTSGSGSGESFADGVQRRNDAMRREMENRANYYVGRGERQMSGRSVGEYDSSKNY